MSDETTGQNEGINVEEPSAVDTMLAQARQDAITHYDKLVDLRDKSITELLRQFGPDSTMIPHSYDQVLATPETAWRVVDKVARTVFETIKHLGAASPLSVFRIFFDIAEERQEKLVANPKMLRTVVAACGMLCRRVAQAESLSYNYWTGLYDSNPDEKDRARKELIARGLIRKSSDNRKGGK